MPNSLHIHLNIPFAPATLSQRVPGPLNPPAFSSHMHQRQQILGIPALTLQRAPDLAEQRVLVGHVLDRDAERGVLLEEGFVVVAQGLEG